MDDALLVGGFDGVRNLACDRERVADLQASLCKARVQRRALDQLQDERLASPDVFDAAVELVEAAGGLDKARDALERLERLRGRL